VKGFENSDLRGESGGRRGREDEFLGRGQGIGEIGREVDVVVEAVLAGHLG
jgi:hypothetical protein